LDWEKLRLPNKMLAEVSNANRKLRLGNSLGAMSVQLVKRNKYSTGFTGILGTGINQEGQIVNEDVFERKIGGML
jgi:hypothetical protein